MAVHYCSPLLCNFPFFLKKSLDEDDLGPRRVVALRKEAQGWARQAEAAVVSIQDITVNYFKETVKALAGNHLKCYTKARVVFLLFRTHLRVSVVSDRRSWGLSVNRQCSAC